MGGMGQVYLAERKGERAAIKVVHRHLASDSTFLARFRREVEASTAVNGPFVAPYWTAG
jgi:serine/threonine protein kinase